MNRRIVSLVLGAVLATVAFACSSASDPKSQCLDGCSKAAKACSKFDRASCESSCNGAASATPVDTPAACKAQADAYQSCARSATVSCPDGMNPQISGCDKQAAALTTCIEENP